VTTRTVTGPSPQDLDENIQATLNERLRQGGVALSSVDPDEIHFSVTSSTSVGGTYHQYAALLVWHQK
jgi:hypothetical protein